MFTHVMFFFGIYFVNVTAKYRVTIEDIFLPAMHRALISLLTQTTERDTRDNIKLNSLSFEGTQ